MYVLVVKEIPVPVVTSVVVLKSVVLVADHPHVLHAVVAVVLHVSVQKTVVANVVYVFARVVQAKTNVFVEINASVTRNAVLDAVLNKCCPDKNININILSV